MGRQKRDNRRPGEKCRKGCPRCEPNSFTGTSSINNSAHPQGTHRTRHSSPPCRSFRCLRSFVNDSEDDGSISPDESTTHPPPPPPRSRPLVPGPEPSPSGAIRSLEPPKGAHGRPPPQRPPSPSDPVLPPPPAPPPRCAHCVRPSTTLQLKVLLPGQWWIGLGSLYRGGGRGALGGPLGIGRRPEN